MEERLIELFLDLLNLSISASWLILAVMLLRLLFRKATKRISCTLWAIVGLRLVLPFSVESVLSLIPSAETVPHDIMYAERPYISSGISSFNSTVNPVIGEMLAPEIGASASPTQIITASCAYIWAVGIIALLVYALVSYIRLKIRMKTATLLKDNIYESERAFSPFVLGIIKPKIYVPYNLSAASAECVTAHEKAHIRRGDHLIKPLAYLIFCIHWFNPFVAAAYILLCRDIEMACDERVIKDFSEEERKNYSEALLGFSINRRSIAACPVAFGEIGVKERIKGVMNYRRPAFWVILLAAVSCAVTGICFLTNPVTEKEEGDAFGAVYGSGRAVYSYRDASYLTAVESYEIDAFGNLWKITDNGESAWCGTLTEAEITKQELFGYIPREKRSDVRTGDFNKVYILQPPSSDGQDNVSYFFTTDGNNALYEATIIKANEKITEDTMLLLIEHERKEGVAVAERDVYSPVIDQAFANIDGDRVKENCVLTYGITSGIYTVVFTATEAGQEAPEYINTFNIPYTGETEFFQADDGTLQIKCGNTVWQDGEDIATEDVFLDIVIEDGNIALYDGGSKISYWGEQGVHPAEFMRKMKALENAVSKAVLGHYGSEKSDCTPFESHEILFIDKDSEKNTVKAYVQLHYEEFSFEYGRVISHSAVGAQAEISFSDFDGERYKVKKYRELDKSENIKDMLPEEVDLGAIVQQLQKEAREKASRHFGVVYYDAQQEYIVVDFLLCHSDERVDNIPSEEIQTVDTFDGEDFHLWNSDGACVFSTEKKNASSSEVEPIKRKLESVYSGKNIDTSFMSSDPLEVIYYIDEKSDEVRYTAYYQNGIPLLLAENDFSRVYAVLPMEYLDEQNDGKIIKSETYVMQTDGKDISEVNIPKLNLVEKEKERTFVLSYDLLSSYMICGTYEIKGRVLAATEDNGNRYIFRINKDNTLTFDGKRSVPLPKLTDERFGCEIYDGAVFSLS